MMQALTLLGPNATNGQKFAAFHAENPGIYRHLVRLARKAKDAGMTRVGIGMLWEVLRWQYSISVHKSHWKLNNSHRSHYARLIMRMEPDLIGFFETREMRAA